MFLFYVIITNTMAYWYDGAALAATRSPVIALFWCLIKFTTTTTTTILYILTTFMQLFPVLCIHCTFLHCSVFFFYLYTLFGMICHFTIFVIIQRPQLTNFLGGIIRFIRLSLYFTLVLKNPH